MDICALVFLSIFFQHVNANNNRHSLPILENMEKFKNKIAVVTGTSSGIGVGICRELIKYDIVVVGLARRIEKLKELSDELNGGNNTAMKFYPIKCDVTVENEIESAFQQITSQFGPITILVNNAGVLGQSLLSEASGDTISQVFDTNVKAPILCAKLAVQSMTENSIKGHIINICSIAGHYMISAAPNYSQIYTSSKHALKIISESLRRELLHKELDIKVTNLSPGRVNSEIFQQNMLAKGHPVTPEFVLQPKDIADACIYVLGTPPNVLVSELSIMPIRQKV